MKIVISFVALMMLFVFSACGGSQNHNYPWPQAENETYIEKYGCLDATAVVSDSLSWDVVQKQSYTDRPDIERYITANPDGDAFIGLRRVLPEGTVIPVALVQLDGPSPAQYISYEGLLIMRKTEGDPSIAEVVDATSGKYYCNWVE